MSEMERLVWAAAYAAEFARERDFRHSYPSAGDVTGISGFSCAEVADVALEKYREAIACDDAKYLLPVNEGWT